VSTPSRRTVKSTLTNIAALMTATAFVATFALSGTSLEPAANAEGSANAEALATLQAAESQTIAFSAETEVAQDLARDEFGATSVAELRRAQLAAAAPKWSGPSVGDFLANPPYPSFSLDQVVQVALQYQGVPYRWGGSTPAGFDCSGFVQYVYAQFGIALPHGVRGQAALGTPISRADARPGDIVIFNNLGHNGIYMGGGQILDAPYAGKSVMVRPIWTDAYYIVRIGI